MKLSERLLQLRLSKGFTREYVAAHSHVSYSALDKLESGERSNPQMTTLKKLAEFYKMDLEELMGTKPEKLRNMANIKFNPKDQQSIDRVNKMREDGLNEEQIDRIVNNAATLTILIENMNLNSKQK